MSTNGGDLINVLAAQLVIDKNFMAELRKDPKNAIQDALDKNHIAYTDADLEYLEGLYFNNKWDETLDNKLYGTAKGKLVGDPKVEAI